MLSEDNSQAFDFLKKELGKLKNSDANNNKNEQKIHRISSINEYQKIIDAMKYAGFIAN